jgi:hypothetical protein
LQKFMGGKLDLFVSPLRGPMVTSDQTHPMEAPKIPINTSSEHGVMDVTSDRQAQEHRTARPAVPRSQSKHFRERSQLLLVGADGTTSRRIGSPGRRRDLKPIHGWLD